MYIMFFSFYSNYLFVVYLINISFLSNIDWNVDIMNNISFNSFCNRNINNNKLFYISLDYLYNWNIFILNFIYISFDSLFYRNCYISSPVYFFCYKKRNINIFYCFDILFNCLNSWYFYYSYFI